MSELDDLRRRYIGGSDAPIIMRGEPQELENLRLEKLGRFKRPDVLKPWALKLRRAVEPLICDWYEIESGRKLSRRQEHIVSAEHPFMAFHADGLDEDLKAVIDAKHLDEHLRDPYEWAREHYAWQIIHQMIVTGWRLGALYVVSGTKEPRQVVIEYDPFQAAELVDRERWFWGHVERDEPIPGVPLPVASTPRAMPGTVAKPMRKLDMTGSNSWAEHAANWLGNKAAAKKFDDATAELKKLVEADVAEATGHGIIAKRDGRGVTIKAKEE